MMTATERGKDMVFLRIGVRIYEMQLDLQEGLKLRVPCLSSDLR